VLFNLRPARPEFRDYRVRVALLRGIDRPGIVGEAWQGQASVADAPIPRVSWAFDGTASQSVPFDRRVATRGLADAGWKAQDGQWTPAGASKPFAFELLSPEFATNQSSFLAAAKVAGDWGRMGLDVTHRPLAPALLVERLRAGDFAAAVVDINVGLDPDLYPLLGSTQATSRGLNVSGLVDPDLDKLLHAARAPGTDDSRRKAYRALQVRLAERQYLLPIAFRDELAVLRDEVEGPEVREVGTPGDRFWDVLTWRLADDR
jgi:peptide/nickel transport system substrate-binding protein